VLTPDFAQAVPVTFSGSPFGQRMQVRTSDGFATVVYTVGGTSPILTVNAAEDTFDAFAPAAVTPSLDAILAAKACAGGDLDGVFLTGDLSGVDFSGASFAGATLDGVVLGSGSRLTGAKLPRATLSAVRCDGAVLDGADLTGATLDGLAWGRPASAKRIVLTGCSARDAVLGTERQPGVDCTEARLGAGDFTGADLRNLVLTGAEAGGAILSRSRLDGAALDRAGLKGAVAVGASLRGATLTAVAAQGASLVRADLSGADLTRAELGANAYLLSLAATFGGELDRFRYPQPGLLRELSGRGVTLSGEDPVTVVEKGRRWEIADAAGTYVLAVNAAGTIDVFLGGQAPATLAGATLQGTKAPGAGLAGVDLRGVHCDGTPAALDHADLGGAVLAGSLLTGTDFTQAHLSGADLSACVLIQARFARCAVGPGAGGQGFSLEGSLVQGADFSDSTLKGALLVDAAVATVRGTPLFVLPSTDQQYLTASGLVALAPKFAARGYPLGSGAAVSAVKAWLLDNAADTDSTSPRVYRVQPVTNGLRVSDGKSGQVLFQLPSASARFLSGPTAPAGLVTAFAQASQGAYTLASGAPITQQTYWEIRPGDDAPRVAAASYRPIRVYPGPERLEVYGCVLALLRDWPKSPPLAFGATQGLDGALDASSLGPSAYPRALVDRGALDWTSFLTAAVAGEGR
jgi:uncharacterized protein YjbI with pentapeptide repeats